MNVGVVTGIPASFAGIPGAQAGSSDVDRAKTETAAQHRTTTSELHAEKAAGIGEADGQDHEIDDRDADGRLPWELGSGDAIAKPQTASPEIDERQSRDATGDSGGQLDLTG
jgi:hypothetical protein